MKKYILCLIFHFLFTTLIAQHKFECNKKFAADYNKEASDIYASADLSKLKIIKGETIDNRYDFKSNKNEIKSDFCDNITEVLLAMKDGNMIDYASEVQSKNNTIIRYKS